MDVSQYLDIFIDESSEHIQTLSDCIMTLEQEPENKDTINEIFKGLTGDNKADIQYLKEQMEQHRDDENSTEIIRALGRKVFELLPDEAKAELNQIIGNEVDTINSTVEEAKFQLSQNNPLKAEEPAQQARDPHKARLSG